MMWSRLSQIVLFIAITFGVSSAARSVQAQEVPLRVIELSPSGYGQGLAVAVSLDGKQFGVGLASGIALYSALSFERQQFIETGAWARSLAYSPDGKTVAAGLFDGTVGLWQTGDGSPVRILKEHTGWVRSVLFSRDGSFLISAADDDRVIVWDLEDGSLRSELGPLTGVRVIALSPDDRTLAVGLQDHSIRLLSISDGSLLKTLTGAEDWVRSLAFSPDGSKLAAGAFDATARLWDVESGRLEFTLSDHQSSVLGIAFSPDGRTLATGSVDSTIKLWEAADGKLLRTLVGHNDFVYGVAFFPDGTHLISSAGDNTAKIWNISSPETDPGIQPSTSSDCRDCHHPRGISEPPRVIQVNCEACHASGIGLNWCAFFPRSAKAVSKAFYVPPVNPVGVPLPAEDLAVVISYPTNGETLYASEYHMSPVFLKGQVFFAGDKSRVSIRLRVFSGQQLTAELSAPVSSEGDFSFSLAVNPAGAPVVAGAKAADPDCSSCHEDFKSQAFLPEGLVQLQVTAVLPDGSRAADERWITVDTSYKVRGTVRLVDRENQSPIPGLPVRAETILYEWRERYSREVSNIDGLAGLSIEALSQADTHYEIRVPPVSMNGYMYESVEPVSLDLPPGAVEFEPLTVYVDVMRGRIRGELRGATPSAPTVIWAILLPEGRAYQTRADNGRFLFDDIPTGEYRVFVDPEMPGQGFQLQAADVDLTAKSDAMIRMDLKAGDKGVASGRILDSEGNPLPFGWITANSGASAVLDSFQGSYFLPGLETQRVGLTVDVPGYYSQAGTLDLSPQPMQSMDFILVRRPETTILSRGEGQIVLPPESNYAISQQIIDLQNGWVWGTVQKDAAIDLKVGEIRITVTAGSFAVQASTAHEGWFYLKEGSAILFTGDGQKIPVEGTQMTAISGRFKPVPIAYQPPVFAGLHLDEKNPFLNTWEPSLGARIRDRLALAGISVVQVVTFVTYMLVQIVIAALLIGGIYSIWKILRRTWK